MKRQIKTFFLALAAALTLSVSCDDMTEEEKNEAGNLFAKFLLTGEYGVLNIADVGSDDSAFGDGISYIDENGKPIVIWVFNLDGTFYSAPNRVWKDKILDGTWKVVKDELQLNLTGIEETRPGDKYKIVSFEDDILTLQSEKVKYVLKRLTDDDKYTQLQAVHFAAQLDNNGKLTIDPSLELNAAGNYELIWWYEPQDYEPYYGLQWSSSNPEIATVKNGFVRPAEGVNSGETTITLICDCVETEITVRFYEVN